MSLKKAKIMKTTTTNESSSSVIHEARVAALEEALKRLPKKFRDKYQIEVNAVTGKYKITVPTIAK